MRIALYIRKRHFAILFAAILVATTVFVVWAYDPTFGKPASAAATFGHSADELVVKMKSDGSVKTVQELLENGIAAPPASLSLKQDDCAWSEWFSLESGTIDGKKCVTGSYVAGTAYKSTTGGADGRMKIYCCKAG